MRFYIVNTIVFSLFICAFTACGNAQNKANQEPVANGQEDEKEEKGPSNKSAKKVNTSFKEGSDYYLFERVRVLDKVGFNEPAEAFSLLLPKGWTEEGNIIWTGPGTSCDGTNSTFRATSPDGKFSFEMLPTTVWGWSSDAQLRQFQQQNTTPSKYCSFGEPMNAEQYLRNVFAPNELDNPEIVSVSPNPDVVKVMAESNEKGRAELMRYGAANLQYYQTAVNAKLNWPGNKRGIVLCGISIIESTNANQYNGTYDKTFTTQASQRIIFKYDAKDEAQAEKMLSVIMSSIRTNPYWKDEVNNFWRNVREQKQIVHIGRIRNMDAQTKAMGDRAIAAGNARLASMDTDMRNWEQRQQSQDRMHTNFVKTIREVENYRDETGKIELSSGYDHAWSRSDGSSFLMSNNPNFDPSSVFQDNRWQEMQKVD